MNQFPISLFWTHDKFSNALFACVSTASETATGLGDVLLLKQLAGIKINIAMHNNY